LFLQLRNVRKFYLPGVQSRLKSLVGLACRKLRDPIPKAFGFEIETKGLSGISIPGNFADAVSPDFGGEFPQLALARS
jgi:hypothetical protein